MDRHGKGAGKGPLVQEELSGTLGTSQDQTLITFAIQGGGETSKACCGLCEETMYTLNTMDRHAVAIGFTNRGDVTGGVSETVRSDPHGAYPHVYAVDMGGGKSSASITKNVSPTLATTHQGEPAIVACDVYNQTIDGEIAATVTAATGGANTSGPKVLICDCCGHSVGEKDISPTLVGGA